MINPNFKKTLITREIGKEIFKVANTEGMTADEIIDACDNDEYYDARICGDFVIIYID